MYKFVEGVGSAISGMFATLFIVAIIGVVSLVCWLGYGVYSLIDNEPTVIESHVRLTPEIKLHTDGKTVDTIYVYKGTK